MDSEDGVAESDRLERGLLSESGFNASCEVDDDEPVLCAASFAEMEESFIKFQTVRWALYSLLLMLAWGIGLFMLLYLPVRRYVLRKDIRSRKLYVTPNAIVYQVTRPVPLPCLGVLKKEKHFLLPSVADIIIEQGYFQSRFGIYSIRIVNNGLRQSPSDDVHIEGIVNPRAFRKAVLTRLSSLRSEALTKQASIVDVPKFGMSSSKSLRQDSLSHRGDLMILQKLDEVGSSVKRVQTLIEEHYSQTTQTLD